jgi:hypothetical protein
MKATQAADKISESPGQPLSQTPLDPVLRRAISVKIKLSTQVEQTRSYSACPMNWRQAYTDAVSIIDQLVQEVQQLRHAAQTSQSVALSGMQAPQRHGRPRDSDVQAVEIKRLKKVVSIVEHSFDLPKGSITGKSRVRKFVDGRSAAVEILYVYFGLGYQAIGRLLQMDHSSAIHLRKRYRDIFLHRSAQQQMCEAALLEITSQNSAR